VVIYYAAGSLYLAAYLRLGRSVVRLRLVPIQARLLWDILRVGAVAALVTLQTNLTVALTTGLAGSFGPAAIAGYGTGSRLEYLLVPLVFGLGGPLVAIVGTSIGAGNRARALKTAWLGAAMAAFIAEAIGLAAATWPLAWLTLFGHDPGMLDAGARYLRMVGPFYGFFGLGMALYFASQGAGRLWWPLGAGVMRLVVAVCGGSIALAMTGNLSMVFLALGFALVLFGLVNAAAVAAGTWFPAASLPALNPRRGLP
jgi:Na+-driven multidrug efflux pump